MAPPPLLTAPEQRGAPGNRGLIRPGNQLNLMKAKSNAQPFRATDRLIRDPLGYPPGGAAIMSVWQVRRGRSGLAVTCHPYCSGARVRCGAARPFVADCRFAPPARPFRPVRPLRLVRWLVPAPFQAERPVLRLVKLARPLPLLGELPCNVPEPA